MKTLRHRLAFRLLLIRSFTPNESTEWKLKGKGFWLSSVRQKNQFQLSNFRPFKFILINFGLLSVLSLFSPLIPLEFIGGTKEIWFNLRRAWKKSVEREKFFFWRFNSECCKSCTVVTGGSGSVVKGSVSMVKEIDWKRLGNAGWSLGRLWKVSRRELIHDGVFL
jgi:hypothetical protein